MCCGSCNIWQHIPCHEERDRRNGRPPRDWEREEFHCSRCRSEPSANGRGTSRTLPARAPQQTKVQLRWDHGRSTTKPTGQTQPPYVGLPVERHDYYLPPASNMTNGGYAYPHPMYNGHPQSLPTSVDQYSNISFSHYQPHQRGFTSRQSQPPIYNPAHYSNAHHPQSQPNHTIGPIYPTYSNGTGNSALQAYHSQPGPSGHHGTSASALPSQVSKNRWPLYPKSDSSERRMASVPLKIGVLPPQMPQVAFISQLPPRMRLGTTPGCMNLPVKPNPNIFP